MNWRKDLIYLLSMCTAARNVDFTDDGFKYLSCNDIAVLFNVVPDFLQNYGSYNHEKIPN